jgi:D-alanyl-D-alanine carboxypeptidase
MFKASTTAAILCSLFVTLLAGCGNANDKNPSPEQPAADPPSVHSAPAQITEPAPASKPSEKENAPADGKASPPVTKPQTPSGTAAADGAEQVVAHPDSIEVLVNKQFMLPEAYKPDDLVYPNVPFTFKEKIEKRMMRKPAADALEKLFAGAKKDGIYLAGVSAYRSYATQKSVFNGYVKKDGLEKAKTYSAVPGHSEHETGLSIDVSGSDGKCAAEDCFAGTKEANWLAKHAAEYGFIIRYPKGDDAITGYQYEPWHIRYVGEKIAKEIAEKGITLEEYFHAVPVSK